VLCYRLKKPQYIYLKIDFGTHFQAHVCKTEVQCVRDLAVRSRGGQVNIVTRLYAGWSGNRGFTPSTGRCLYLHCTEVGCRYQDLLSGGNRQPLLCRQSDRDLRRLLASSYCQMLKQNWDIFPPAPPHVFGTRWVVQHKEMITFTLRCIFPLSSS
jgi:hypothetical protein